MTTMSRLLPATMLFFLVVGASYSVLVPLWEAPDERDHFHHCQFLVKNGVLPPFVGARAANTDSTVLWPQSPPLYYALGGLLVGSQAEYAHPHVHFRPRRYTLYYCDLPRTTFPYDGVIRRVHLLRLATLALGAMTLWLTWRTARLLFPADPAAALAALAFHVAIPQFAFISATVNNENLCNTLTAFCIYLLIRLVCRPFRWSTPVSLGLALGGALLAKQSAFYLGPAIVLAVGLEWRRHRSVRRSLAVLAVIGGLALAVAGWWYARNAILYGDPFGTRDTQAVVQKHWGEEMGARPLTVSTLLEMFKYWFGSFWVSIGQLALHLPKPWYLALGVACLASLIGLADSFRRNGRQPLLRAEERQGLLLLVVAVVALVALGVKYNLQIYTPQGRNFFVGIVPISILGGTGFLSFWPASSRERGAGVMLVAAVLFQTIVLLGYVAPVNWNAQ